MTCLNRHKDKKSDMNCKGVNTLVKRNLVIILGLILVLNTVILPIEISASAPSSWAEEKVTKAVSEEIVPNQLRSSYQSEIKRYEYVLIALELLQLNNDQVAIAQNYPFYDIHGHPYEAEIVKAYNADIIKGDGNGTFRPDDPINRQEIASLVVNLAKRLNNVETLNLAQTKTYSDVTSISSWATGYINYCYNNKIMNGVGKDANGLDRIDPLGYASREQAILLLYRLAENSGLFTDIDLGTITVVSYTDNGNDDVDPNETSVESTTINEFAKVFGRTLAKALIELSNESNVEIASLEKEFVYINFINEGKITISHDGFGVDMKLRLKNLSDVNQISDYISLAKVLNNSESLEDVMYRDLNLLGSDPTYGFSQQLSDNESYSSRTEIIDDITWFEFSYRLNSN